MIQYNTAVARVSGTTQFAGVVSEELKFDRRVRASFSGLGSSYLLAPRVAVYHPLEDVAHGSAFIRLVHVGHRRVLSPSAGREGSRSLRCTNTRTHTRCEQVCSWDEK